MQGRECRAGAQSEGCDPLRVAAKGCYVVFDPLETSSLVSHPNVQGLLVPEYGQASEPEDGEPVIQGNMLGRDISERFIGDK